MAINKREILGQVSFGARVAEEESVDFSQYFVETDQWKRMYAGEVDVIYGAKGSGKSAIYSLILSRSGLLEQRGVDVLPAEDPRGATVFKDLVADPPTSEMEFRNLWKLYFLVLLASKLRETRNSSVKAARVVDEVVRAQLLPKEFSLRAALRNALEYVRRRLKAESVETGLKIDPVSGTPEWTGKITFREPGPSELSSGLISVDSLIQLANVALEETGRVVWLLLDRLDVAFLDSPLLESNALRALFRVYVDFRSYDRVALKIFLRTDIWKAINAAGVFREASHITRHLTINWNSNSLFRLVIQRILHNASLRDSYNVSPDAVLANTGMQVELFYRIFPPQLDSGPNKPKTFDWMLSRTRDATGENAPRELIHLLSAAREEQLKMLEIGTPEPADQMLFDRNAIKQALPEVSRARFEQTLCAEYPHLQNLLRKLEGEKTAQDARTLAKIWSCSETEARLRADDLAGIGFFEKRGNKENPEYWVPFLYRDALAMVQGAAE